MPRVEAYGGLKVDARPVSGVKRTGGSPHGEGLARLGALGAEVGVAQYQAARDKADEVAVLEAHNQLSSWRQRRLYDPESGALTIKGKESFGLPDTLEEEFTAVAGTIEGTLAGGRQTAAFARIRASQLESLRGTVFGHVSRERETFYTEQAQAGVALAASDAVANADNLPLVSKHLGLGAAIIRDHLKGQAPETVDAAVLKFTTGVHTGVIDRMLGTDQDRGARIYFEETKAQIDGAAIARIEAALDEGSLRGESQRAADAIVAKGGSLKDWRTAAKAIDDPEVRDAVLARVEDEGRMQAAEQRAASEATLRSAYDIVDKTGSWRKIPPALWTVLDGSDRSALRSYAKAMAEGVGIKTDPGELYKLLTLSSTNEDAFLKTNLLQYRTSLSPADLEQMMRMQAEKRSGKKDGASLFVSERNQNEIVDAGLREIGVDPTPAAPGATAYNKATSDRAVALRRSVREAVTRLEQRTGKKATDAEVQSITDTLIAPVGVRLKTDRMWPRGNVYEASRAFETAQAQARSIADVPIAERRQIERALKSHGVAQPSDAQILQLFNQRLADVRGDR